MGYDVVYFGCEALKSFSGIHAVRDGSLALRHQGLVASEAEIDKPSPVFFRLPDIRVHCLEIVLDGLHLPDDVVSKPEHVYGLVQTGNTCAYSHGGKVVIFLHYPTMNTKHTAKGSASQARRKKPAVQAGHV